MANVGCSCMIFSDTKAVLAKTLAGKVPVTQNLSAFAIVSTLLEFKYDSIPKLVEILDEYFGNEVGLPRIQDEDLELLDKAIALLNPPVAQVRVVETTTFIESEQSVVRGDVPLDQGDYSLSQKAIILQRITSTSGLPPRAPPASIEEDISVPAGLFSQQPAPVVSIPQEGGDQHVDKLPLAKATEAGRGYDDYHGEAIDQQTSDSAKLLTGPRLTEKTKVMRPWRELPEIILFWSRDRRLGGNLIVCPNESMNRLVQAYLVCEVVEHSKKKIGGYLSDRQGMLLGVEIGECLPAEQDTLQNLLTNFSFQDASLGVVSLVLSAIYFGHYGHDHVNILTLLAVGIVAGLNQEATWPWMFNLLIKCSRMTDPMVKVTQCKRVHNHQGQQSGQGVLTIGLAVFGVYLEIWPANGNTPVLFRILLNLFQGVFILIIIINMVQAVVPMSVTESKSLEDLLRPWAKTLIHERSFDKNWLLTILVALVWIGTIAAVAGTRSFDPENDQRALDIFFVCFIVLCASFLTINPGVAILSLWGIIWLVPTGVAFVMRSAFDVTNRVILWASLWLRRMARESLSHVRANVHHCTPANTVILVFQVLPLAPLMLMFLPLPLLYLAEWFMHMLLRGVLLLSDTIITPITTFKLYPLLSDYGSVTWMMSSLDMPVERTSMRTLLKRRVSQLLEGGKLGDLVRTGVIPSSPYCHLGQGPPRLGCVAIMPGESHNRILKVDRTNLSGGEASRDREV